MGTTSDLVCGILAKQNSKSNTIKLYISAIKAILSYGNIELNKHKVLLNSLTQACKLNNDRINMKLPVHRNLLSILITSIHKLYKAPQPYLICLYLVLLLTMYYGLFHIGEVTYSQHVVKARNVHIGQNKDKLLFILLTSKTHNEGSKPQIIKINRVATQTKSENDNHMCPFRALKAYIKVRKHYIHDNEQFFIFRDKSPVLPSHLRNLLKELLILNGLNLLRYSVHGIRSGRAGDLLDMGLSVELSRRSADGDPMLFMLICKISKQNISSHFR